MNKHQFQLSYIAALGILLALATVGAGRKMAPVEGPGIENDARALQQFNEGVQAYTSLHNRAETGMPHIIASPSGANIVQRQRSLATNIQAARHAAREGDIFTPDVSAYFRRKINAAYMTNFDGIQASLETAALLDSRKIAVNQSYPEDAPRAMMPPTILLHLPRLPEMMQYAIVGHDLLIRDVECNQVVDVTRNVIP